MAYVKVGNRVGTIGLEKKINSIAQRKSHEIGTQMKNLCIAKCPVYTGTLRKAIRLKSNGKYEVQVFIDKSIAPHAKYVLGGHGTIYPVRAKFLKFKPKGSDRYVYAKKVKPVKPNNFMHEALMEVKARRNTKSKGTYNPNI